MPGLDHATIIAGTMPEVFKFFGQHTKTVSCHDITEFR